MVGQPLAFLEAVCLVERAGTLVDNSDGDAQRRDSPVPKAVDERVEQHRPAALAAVAGGDGEFDETGYALAVADDETGYLVELAVAAGHRGQGRGSALLDALVDRFRDRGVTTLRVTVRVVDERARSFYEAHGFEERERLPDHYEDCDGLLLARDI